MSASAALAAHVVGARGSQANKPPPDAVFTFVQICDTQLGMGGYEHDVDTFRLAVKHINELSPRPAFVLVCGDLVNTPGSEKELAEFLAIKAGLKMDCFCVPGNHDVGNKVKPELLKRYRETLGRDYYTKELPQCVLVALNTQLWKSPIEVESAKQDAWLTRSMPEGAAVRKPVIAFGHSPLFVREPQEKEEYYSLPVESRLRLLDLFKRHGVAAYLSGHAHKNMVRQYEGIQLVTTATPSRNFDGAPMGFRLCRVGSVRPWTHEYVPIRDAKPPAVQGKPHAKTQPGAASAVSN